MSRRTRWITVDDSSTGITFTGPWVITDDQFGGLDNSFGPPHGGSQHATKSTGTFTFKFEGSGVQVYGTSYQTNTSGVVDPIWTCSVDGVSYGRREGFEFYPVNQWPLCLIQLDSSGPHTLSVTAVTVNETFYVDLIQYRPDYNLRDTIHPTVLIDSADPAVRYLQGEWTEFTNATMVTVERGATVRVDFNGTKATWVGMIPSGYPQGTSKATWSIDGKSPVEFDVRGLDPESNGTMYYHPFFETPTLDYGLHTLEVVHNGRAAPLSLDYLRVESGDIFLPDGVPSTREDPRPSRKTPIGAIVGGTVGGVVFLSIIAIAIFFIIKRRRKSRSLVQPNLKLDYTGTTYTGSSPTSTGNPPYLQPLLHPSANSSHSPTGVNATSTSYVPVLQHSPPMQQALLAPNLASSSNAVPISSNNVPVYYTQAVAPTPPPVWSPTDQMSSYPAALQSYSHQGRLYPSTAQPPNDQKVR